ncbi:MAG: hypothetical protein IJO88_01045 [Oscillospiraceae bacterium]|nr:hypothetical protein [Oscillospiraceae bacterium]
MKKLKLTRPSLLSVIMAVAMVFLAGILIAGAVSQFLDGHWFSGCVSILGVILVAAVCALLIVDVKKKRKK